MKQSSGVFLKMFLKMLQNLLENTSARVSFQFETDSGTGVSF